MRRLACLVSLSAIVAACSSGAPPGAAQPAALAQAQPAISPPQAAAAPPANAPVAAPAASAPVAPAAAPVQPAVREVVLPSGTTLNLTLETAVSSDKSHVEDAVRARLAKAIVIDGTTVVPAGAEAIGSVLEAQQSGRVKGRASVAFRFDRLRAGDETHTIRTARIARVAEATKGEDAKKVGIGAGAGAVIGAIAGGKKGLAIGGLVGAGAGTGAVVATRGKEVQLAPGTAVKTTLQEPLTVRVRLE